MLLILSYHSWLPTAGRSFSGQDWETHKSLDIVGLRQYMQICLWDPGFEDPKSGLMLQTPSI